MLTSELGAPTPLLLDTHIWVWAAAGVTHRVAPAVLLAIDHAAVERRLYISVVSVWEVALKVERGELELTSDLRAWVGEQEREPGIRVVPLTPAIMIDSVQLPPWTRESDGKPHRDPCDRFLVATARARHSVLLTVDAEILSYARAGHVRACDVSR